MEEGTRVEVRSRFDASWAHGFDVYEVVELAEGGLRFRIRRRSDGSVLPALFDVDDLREEKHKSMWWH